MINIKKLCRQKKGKSEDILYWFLYLPLTAAVILLIATGTKAILAKSIDTYDLEYLFYGERLTNAVSYQDRETGRLYPRVIDLTKFNEDTLSKSMDNKNYKGVEFGIKLELQFLFGGTPEKIIFLNQENYKDYKIFGIKRIEKNVIIKSETGNKQGKLIIETAIHRKKYLS
jgi:hypothetical protein